jgi:hypothetical protein
MGSDCAPPGEARLRAFPIDRLHHARKPIGRRSTRPGMGRLDTRKARPVVPPQKCSSRPFWFDSCAFSFVDLQSQQVAFEPAVSRPVVRPLLEREEGARSLRKSMVFRFVEVVMSDLSYPAINPFAGRLSPCILGGGRSHIAKVRLSLHERDAFYRRAYSEDRAPSLLLRRFAEAYVSGATVPPLSDTAARHEASHLAGPVAFAVSRDLYERLRARAQAECVSVSPVLRRFVLAYLRQVSIGEPDT